MLKKMGEMLPSLTCLQKKIQVDLKTGCLWLFIVNYGFKNRLPLAIHSKLFAFALKHLKSSTKPALCKEDLSLWKSLGLAFNGCHCLLDSNDGLIIPRQYLVDQLSEKTLIAIMQSGRYLHRLHIKQRRQP